MSTPAWYDEPDWTESGIAEPEMIQMSEPDMPGLEGTGPLRHMVARLHKHTPEPYMPEPDIPAELGMSGPHMAERNKTVQMAERDDSFPCWPPSVQPVVVRPQLTAAQKLDIERKRKEAMDRLHLKSMARKVEIAVPVPTKLEPVKPKQTPFTVAFSLISRLRFIAKANYHKDLIAEFRKVPGSTYDAKSKCWTFSTKDHDMLVEKINSLSYVTSLDPLPIFLTRLFKDVSEKVVIPEADLKMVEPAIRDQMFPFQVTGFNFGIFKKGRCLIADDMGLGKTIQALAIASYYRSDWPLLIVAPSSVRYAWREALFKWMPSVDPQLIRVLDTGKDEIISALVYIMSYDLVVRMSKEIARKDFQIIIADESHMMKSKKSARTTTMFPLLKKAKRVILLSGTPALSRPLELFTQIDAINKRTFISFTQFGVRYCAGKESKFGWDFSGSSNTTELVLFLEELAMIRRLKTDVIKELPPKQRQMIVLDSTAINRSNKAMLEGVSLMNDKRIVGNERRGHLLTYFSNTAAVKLQAASSYLMDLLDNDKKFICFAHHKVMLDGLASALTRKSYKYIRIEGSTSSEMRKKLCDKFQCNDDYRVALLSITAACTGITLTAANLVVFAELFWNPGILTQAEDRAHRIGQVDSVLVQYLVAKGTADDFIWPMVQSKLDVLNKAGLSKDDFKDANMITSELADASQPTIDTFFDLKFDDDFNWWEEIQNDNLNIEVGAPPSQQKVNIEVSAPPPQKKVKI